MNRKIYPISKSESKKVRKESMLKLGKKKKELLVQFLFFAPPLGLEPRTL